MDLKNIDSRASIENGPRDLESRSQTPPDCETAPLRARTTRKQWLLILSAFVVFLDSWGLVLAFGAFQAYYEQTLLSLHSPSSISWISTTCGFLLMVCGLVTGSLYDYGYLRSLLLYGSLLEVFGLFMTSISTKYYQVFLAQGVCVGIGGGMLYVPSIAAAAASFEDPGRRSKVIGLIASGTGIGGVIYPIMFNKLLTAVGFPWAIRSIAFVVMATYLFSYGILFYKPVKSLRVRDWFDTSVLKDLPFLSICLGAFFAGTAYYVPLLYVQTFAQTVASASNVNLANYMLAIVNGSSVIGRLAAGAIASRIGAIETEFLSLLCCCVLLFCWIAVTNIPGMIVWSIFWGAFSSALAALPGAMIPLLTPSVLFIGTRTGMYWACIGIGVLIGSPIGGSLVDISPSGTSFLKLQIFTAAFMAVGALLHIYPILYVRGRQRAALPHN